MPSVVMPQPGQSVTEGTVIKWLKQVGDQVKEDEILVEIETEKVNVEVPSPFEGTLTQILVQEGDTVPVGSDLAVIGEAGSAPSPGVTPSQSDAEQVEAAADAQVMTDGDQPPERPVGQGGVVVQPATAAAPVRPERPPVAAPARNGTNAADHAAGRYSPAVLRLAAEHKLDLSAIAGTGMGGRVTRKDVVQFLERGPRPGGESAPSVAGVATTTAAAPAERSVAPEAPATAPGSAATPSPAAVAPAAASPAPTAPSPVGEDEEVIRPSPTRLTIARNMLRTAQTVPTAWMVVEVDVTGLVRLRDKHKEAFRQREGVDLSYLPFVIQAVTGALREQPMLNTEWRDEQIVLKKRINMGVAVGVEDGLVVPVIHNADRLSVTGLAHAIADLAARARTRKLRIEDVTGGTFTLDNTGVFGSLVSQPIINPPQAAILSTEAIVRRPVVVDDAIAVRSMMNLCIAFDHRIVDGSHVGPFMQSVKRRLEAYTAESPMA